MTKAISSLAVKYYIRLPGEQTPFEIRNNPKLYSFFKIVGWPLTARTHIPVFVPNALANRYRDRKGNLSQNALAACSFDMLFTYVLAGWKGSAHDCVVHARQKSISTPPGKYDLGDAGYALSTKVLTPYRGVRYHLREWQKGNLR